jgi:predicted nucleotidyltransferase
MIPNDILTSDPGLSDWCILSGYRGSIAHGMFVPQSNPNSIDDKDVMAVCVPPPDCYVGLKDYGSRGTKEIMRGEWDIVIYELKKFMSMLLQGNPNVLGMLWLEPRFYLTKTEVGDMLLRRRELFVGRHVYRSFAGYAHGQLHRMTHAACEGYMGEKRKKLVEKFGYDTKNAAHLVRLLRMAIEFLKDGELYVLRQDSQQLLEIKRGEWTLDQVKAEADRLFKLADQAYLDSKLPKEPQKEAVNMLCQEMILETWRGRGTI